MIVVYAILALALVLPLLLFAIALGPVILGILCAVGFGLIVFAVVNFFVGLGLFGRSAERAGMRRLHH